MARRRDSDEPVGFWDSPDGFVFVSFALLIIAVVLSLLVLGGEAPQQKPVPDRGAAEGISD